MNKQSHTNRLLVLIIEDDATTSELESRVLNRSGMEVRIADTMAKGMECLKRDEFSAILLDYRLQDGVCWPVLEAAKQYAPHTPVVVVTAMGDERIAVEAMRRGAADYVVKSSESLKQLPAIVKRAVRHYETEHALAESNLRLSAAIQASNTGLWDWNIQTQEVVYSKEWKGLLGYEESEIGDHFSDWENRLHPNDRERALATVSAYLSGSTPAYELEHRLCHKDGTYRWILARGKVLRDADGKPVRMLGSHVDITKRKLAEEALIESENQHRDLLDNATDLIHSVTPDGRFIYVNRAWRETLGYAESEVAGLTIRDIILPACRAHCMELFKRVKTGEIVRNFEATFTAENGKEICLEGNSSCMMKDGEPQFTRSIFRDITQRKSLEAQLRQSQKIDAVGQLAGGIAHDFNNLLTVINGYSELLMAAWCAKISPLFLSLRRA